MHLSSQLIASMPLLLLIMICGPAGPHALSHAQDVEMIHRWQLDPDLDSRWTAEPRGRPRPADIERLQFPSVQMQVDGAQAIILQSRFGVTNRREAFEVALQELQQSRGALQARLTMVSAALRLANSKQEVESVWSAVAEDTAVRTIVEPELVNWESAAALELWRQRLKIAADSSEVYRASDLFTALEGIAATGSSNDRPALESLLARDYAVPIQIAAADALGQVSASGLESLAEQILESDRPFRFLLAAKLLSRHVGSEAAESLLERILENSSPPAQLVAYRGLATLNRDRARDLAEEFVQHSDNNMRLAALRVLNAYDDAASLNVQAIGLPDENPSVRNRVRVNLREKAGLPQLRPGVDKIIGFHLSGERWQGAEQALTLVVELEDTTRVPELLKLLDHPRPEVFIRAAWALQMLELPASALEAIFKRVQASTQRRLDQQPVAFEEDAQTAFLIEALGRHAYRPANDMLRIYIPKNSQMPGLPRAAAIYALGMIWKDSRDRELATQLAERMLDESPTNPEVYIVRYSSAIALGRIKDPAAAEALEYIGTDPGFPLPDAATWSLQQLSAGD